MSPEDEIDYVALIDRSIKDFQPVKRLWPVGTRLTLWILLETAILALAAGFGGNDPADLTHDLGNLLAAGLLIFVSIVAAFLALRSAIPGREVTWSELLLLLAVLCLTFSINFEPLAGAIPSRESVRAGVVSTLQLLGLATPSWLALFWAVRRGVPLQPAKTGTLVGIAAFCFAIAANGFISSGLPRPTMWLKLSGTLVTVVSAGAGAVWLNWIDRWQQDRDAAEAETIKWTPFNAGTVFPTAIIASIVALIFILKVTSENFAPIPDFDLAIENYERSLGGFRPNVPSSSIETVLTAYIEHGMPAYMWDFSPQGFKLVGGRWEHLPDGTPVTYTWFRGTKRGVICMFRQSYGFNPPSTIHEQHHHLLFYRYRGFSVCLSNVGGYGNFIGVIAAPMPMTQFVRLVLAAAL
jgi:negative regulator of sigma F NrsF-like protein